MADNLPIAHPSGDATVRVITFWRLPAPDFEGLYVILGSDGRWWTSHDHLHWFLVPPAADSELILTVSPG